MEAADKKLSACGGQFLSFISLHKLAFSAYSNKNRQDYASCVGVIRLWGLRTRNYPPCGGIFYFFRILFEASFRGPFKTKNPACAG